MPNRLEMEINLDDIQSEDKFFCRLITLEDSKELGELMYESYLGTTDYSGETREEAAFEIESTFNGKYGKVIREASLVVESENQLASAIIYTWCEKRKMPLLTFTMTKPHFKGQGMSQFLIKRSMSKLFQLGYSKCSLVVTEGNQPAQSIYEKIGFRITK